MQGAAVFLRLYSLLVALAYSKFLRSLRAGVFKVGGMRGKELFNASYEGLRLMGASAVYHFE